MASFASRLDDAKIPEGTEAVLIYDQIRVGQIKFQGKGNPPIRHMGPVFAGFVPPDRETLGDLDEAEWEKGFSGKPVDPWQFQVLLPLQDTKTGELLIFGTSSITGRRACDNLIAMCGRMQVREPDDYPVVRLDVSGFQHRDERIGWVKVPAFTRVGKAPKSDVSVAVTKVADDMSGRNSLVSFPRRKCRGHCLGGLGERCRGTSTSAAWLYCQVQGFREGAPRCAALLSRHRDRAQPSRKLRPAKG